MRLWWDKIDSLGPKIGYFVKASKSWLIVKSEFLDEARKIFEGSGLNITTEGRRHLGAVIGSDSFKAAYVSNHVDDCINKLKELTEIAKCEPHSAFAAYTHGFRSKYIYILRTIPNISQLLAPLDKAVDDFLSVLFQGKVFSSNLRKLFALPVKMGGLGIEIPSEISDVHYINSRSITSQLVTHIETHSQTSMLNVELLKLAKLKVQSDKNVRHKALVETLSDSLNVLQKLLVSLTKRKGPLYGRQIFLWLTKVS